MLKEALKFIVDLKKPEQIKVEDKTYYNDSFVPARDYYPGKLGINNLTGIVDYIKEKPESWPGIFFIHIKDFDSVILYQSMFGKFNQREAVLIAKSRPCQFNFGAKMSLEDFIISMRSMFLNNDDQEYLLNFVSGVKVDASAEIEDDGVSQKVTARHGTSSLKTEMTIKPVVLLKPFRTFNEVEQPESEFVFRLGANSEQSPRVSLHECDGEAWKQTAIQRIKDYFKEQNLEIPIIA